MIPSPFKHTTIGKTTAFTPVKKLLEQKKLPPAGWTLGSSAASYIKK